MGGACARREVPVPSGPGCITFEDIGQYPRRAELGSQGAPSGFSFTPDNKGVAFLQSDTGSLRRTLYSAQLSDGTVTQVVDLSDDPAAGAPEKLNLEEQLRRERLRQLHTGVTRFEWSRGGLILVPLDQKLFIQRGPAEKLTQLFDASALPGPPLDARLCAGGAFVAFVSDREVYACSTDAKGPGKPLQLTFGARERGLSNGLADYIAEEEMGRNQGFWVSPDGSLLAFEQVDERHIPTYRIVHQGSDQTGAAAQEDHRYPFAGAENPKVRLGIVPVVTQAEKLSSKTRPEPLWLDLEQSFGQDFYLARVLWSSAEKLTVVLENREQTRIDVVEFDAKTGARRALWSDTESKAWINLGDDLLPLRSRPGTYVWSSERTGFRHIYLVDTAKENKKSGGSAEEKAPAEAVIQAVTSGEWVVDGVVAVDETKCLIYFLGNKGDCKDRHLYCVSYGVNEIGSGGSGPSKPRVLTTSPGVHSAVVSVAAGVFVDTFSSVNHPPRVQLARLSDGKVLRTFYDGAVTAPARLAELKLSPPEFVTVKTPQSEAGFPLCGALYKPDSAVYGPGPYPTIVSVYGGPCHQAVVNGWNLTADLRAQKLAQNGYAVFKLDNRGSSRRGLAFESNLKLSMGTAEVQDQVAGVQYLVSRGIADPARVGVYGWSYGGYMTLMCLAKASSVFCAGVSGAPVTHWDGYDTHYTERYMGTPKSNPKGYEQGSVMRFAKQIKGELMIVHGLIDENVHFRHTARLINSLIKCRKRYELLLFPGERHQPRDEQDRVYMEQCMFQFFDRAVRDAKPKAVATAASS